MRQREAKGRFGQPIERDLEVGRDLLHPTIDFLLPVAPEVVVPEIVLGKVGLRRDLPVRSSFYDSAAFGRGFALNPGSAGAPSPSTSLSFLSLSPPLICSIPTRFKPLGDRG